MDFLQKPEQFSIKTDYHTFLIIDKCKTTNFLKTFENQVLTDAAKINVNRIQNYRQNENDELGPKCITHRVISDRVHRLLVTLSYFRPDRFVQLLSLIPILILLLYYLVSGCLTSLC